MFWIHVCGHGAGCSVEYSEWMVWCRWQLECWLVGVGVILYSMMILKCWRLCCSVGAGAWLWRWHVYCSCAWCVWLSGVVLFQVCGCWRLYVGPRWCWHILRWDVLVLCKLVVWFRVGTCECFCRGRLLLLMSCPSHNVLPLAGACLCPLCHCGKVVSRKASSSRWQERRWAIVCGSPQSQSTDWGSSRKPHLLITVFARPTPVRSRLSTRQQSQSSPDPAGKDSATSSPM